MPLHKLFLDDIREPWDNTWAVVRSFKAFQHYIVKFGIPDVIAFDHDLGEQHYQAYKSGVEAVYDEGTGYDCAKWLEDYADEHNVALPSVVFVHSWNTGGREIIAALFEKYGDDEVQVIATPYPCSDFKKEILRLADPTLESRKEK